MRNNTLTNDSLSDMSDDQIIKAVDYLKRTARRRGEEGSQAQVELCYAQRELEWRRTRREAHKVYLRRIGARPYRSHRGHPSKKAN